MKTTTSTMDSEAKQTGIVTCPSCGARVLPRSDGVCPSCRQKTFDRPGATDPRSPAVTKKAVLGRGAAGEPGIRGWLILPAIGLVVSPVLLVIVIIQQILTLLDHGQYRQLDILFFLGFDILSKVVLLVLVCVVAYLFFKRRSGAPTTFILYLLAYLGFAGVELLWGMIAFGADTLVPLLRSTNIIGIAIACAIWIPYFRLSRQVKRTFTR